VVEQSIIVAPLRQRDTYVGAISAQSRRPTAYDEGDLQLLAAIANEASIALERANSTTARRRFPRRLFELPASVSRFSEKTEVVDVAKLLAESVRRPAEAGRGRNLCRQGRGNPGLRVHDGEGDERRARAAEDLAVISRVLESGQPVTFARRADARIHAKAP